MGRRSVAALAATLAAVAAEAGEPGTPGFTMVGVDSYTSLRTSGQSTLYEAKTSPAQYEIAPKVLHLKGTPYQAGFDYGVLVGPASLKIYQGFLKSLLPDPSELTLVKPVLEAFLDWQWSSFLSKQLPQEYLDELKGVKAGCESVKSPGADKVWTRITVLANLPGTLGDIKYVLQRELEAGRVTSRFTEDVAWLLDTVPNLGGHQCSFIAAWGTRTEGGRLLTSRNLDWNRDTGVTTEKMVTVYEIDGQVPYATFGFAGMAGALAGVSKAGITVAEANLETDTEGFEGFPWTLRLRHVMAKATDLKSAEQIWADTDNTVGFNHMVGSAADAPAGPAAAAMETMFGYTAYFHDDDPREASFEWQNATSGEAVKIGSPMKEAVWRTNHGYDPKIMQHYTWDYSPRSWSVRRYGFVRDSLSEYEADGVKMGVLQFVNATSVVGNSGQHDPHKCSMPADPTGDNVLSTVFDPSVGHAHVAWETGTGDTWQAAACALYVDFDLTKFWGPQELGASARARAVPRRAAQA